MKQAIFLGQPICKKCKQPCEPFEMHVVEIDEEALAFCSRKCMDQMVVRCDPASALGEESR